MLIHLGPGCCITCTDKSDEVMCDVVAPWASCAPGTRCVAGRNPLCRGSILTRWTASQTLRFDFVLISLLCLVGAGCNVSAILSPSYSQGVVYAQGSWVVFALQYFPAFPLGCHGIC
jgi:hypothetical protein